MNNSITYLIEDLPSHPCRPANSLVRETSEYRVSHHDLSNHAIYVSLPDNMEQDTTKMRALPLTWTEGAVVTGMSE